MDGQKVQNKSFVVEYFIPHTKTKKSFKDLEEAKTFSKILKELGLFYRLLAEIELEHI